MKQGSRRGLLATMLAFAATAAMHERGAAHYHTVASKYKNRDAFMLNTRKAPPGPRARAAQQREGKVNRLKGWAKAQRMRRRSCNWSKEYQAAHDEYSKEMRRKIAAEMEKRHGVQP